MRLCTPSLLTQVILFSGALLTMSLLSGCPVGDQTAGPVKTCQKPGQQCKMGQGKLGVCSANMDGSLTCMSQH